MTRPLLPALALAAAASLLTAGGAAAACGGKVSFPAGASQTTLKGSVSGADVCDYRLKAKKGQSLRATLKAANGTEVILFDPIEANLSDGAPLLLPQDGTYTVRVLQTRNAARKGKTQKFSLTLAVTGKAAAAAPAPAKPQAAAPGTRCDAPLASAGMVNLSGHIAGDGVCSFSFDGVAGQTLTPLLDAPSGMGLHLVSPVETELLPGAPFTLPQTGAYEVRVGLTRAAARRGTSADFSAVLNLD